MLSQRKKSKNRAPPILFAMQTKPRSVWVAWSANKSELSFLLWKSH